VSGGNWPKDIPLQDGTLLQIFSKNNFSVHLGGTNIFDGVQGLLQIPEIRTLLWHDEKFLQWGGDDTLGPSEMEDELTNLEVARKHLPNFEHLLAVVTTKRVTKDAANKVLSGKKGVCVVSATDDGFAWALCHTLSFMLVQGRN